MRAMPFDTDPPLRTLRQFGALWLIVFGALAAAAWHGGRPAPWPAALAGLAVAVPLVGWFRPRVLRWAWIALSAVAWPIGTAVSLVLLTLIWLLVVTPVGLVLRLMGYDPLERRLDRSAGSHWRERPVGGREARRYFRQF